MATDMFLELDGIVGDSDDVKHVDQIEIQSWSTSFEQPMSLAKTATGPTVERVKAEPITVAKIMCGATPDLLIHIWSGKLIKTGNIYCYRADDDGGSPIQYLKIGMMHILITTYNLSGAEGDLPQEELGLSCGFMEFIYNPQLKEGGAEGVIGADMNFITGVYGES